ncbi:hypothetical protein ACFRFL_15955 [Streptomyces sp. NPDC056708]|uniref:hypothetical protein n=1 Tax=unclassified Streptomyces TaxID=2593676 RepID=UPI0036B53FBF
MTWRTWALVCLRTLPPTSSAAPHTDKGAEIPRMASCFGHSVIISHSVVTR